MKGPKAPRMPTAPPSYTDGRFDEVEPDARLEALDFERDDAEGADLSEVTFTECRLRHVSLHEADLKSATFAESSLSDINAPVFSAPHSSWWNTAVENARVGSGELYDSVFRSVTFTGGKLDYLNFRYAKLTDVLFSGCIIDELDFSHAKLVRVAFEDCRIGTLHASGAMMQGVDLRANELSRIVSLAGLKGASIDEYQLQLLAPALARELGINVG
ncbi:pentapeptide repeat-containing protein [Arthrobacter monumenti]